MQASRQDYGADFGQLIQIPDSAVFLCAALDSCTGLSTRSGTRLELLIAALNRHFPNSVAIRLPQMIFLIDNYDSFTYNLVQRIGEIDGSVEIRVERNDQTSLEQIEQLAPERIIISPGPCTPKEAGLSKEVVRHFGPRLPVLGVCLGHQCLAEVYGARVDRAKRLMHGKTSWIHHDGAGVFSGLPSPFEATRYHSLIVLKESIPGCLEVTAWVDEGEHGFEVMGIRHRHHPVHGVQFHPESFLTGHGHDLLRNFLQLAAGNTVPA